MKVPFVDLKQQYQALKPEIDAAIQHVINNTAFVGAPVVGDFERAFARACGVKHCISVGNGTDAIYIALKMLGIGQGDEVITVANSWISTSETISQTGARPVFVDIEENYFTINLAQIEEKITSRTKAIVPVHLFGQTANMDTIKAICEKHNLFLIEDCAQSHFSTFAGQTAGTFGHAATFSFYPGKNLGAYGDGGAIITNDDSLADRIRMFANHGALVKHQHMIEGINSRLDSIQAAVLYVKLPHINKWNDSRYQHAMLYNDLLKDLPQIKTPKARDGSKHTFHLYVICAEKRTELMAYLAENGVGTQIHYPTPLPLLPAYAHLGYSKEDFPVAVSYMDKIVSLPMFPELTEEEIRYVSACIHKFYEKH